MTPALPLDVRVCLPRHGCTLYTPGAGQLMNAVIAVGPGPVDAAFAGALAALLALAVGALVVALRRRSRPGAPVLPAVLLVSGGLLAAIPPLATAVAPTAEVFLLASSACVGSGFLVLGARLPRPLGLLFVVLGALRLLELPVALAQYATGSPAGSLPERVLGGIEGLALVLVALVQLVSGRGALRWALLLPIAVALPISIRLQMVPFAAPVWTDLLQPAAITAMGALVATGRFVHVPAARSSRVVGTVAASTFGVTLVVLLAWPASAIGKPAAGEPVIGPVRTVTAATAPVLPLDEVAQPAVDRAKVLRAENTLIERCGAQHHIAVYPVDLLPAEPAETAARQLGLVDPGQAAVSGYWVRLADSASSPPWKAADARVLADCVSGARARLGDDGGAQIAVSNAQSGTLAQADGDSRVHRVRAAWSRCMLLRGFAVAVPEDVQLGWGAGEGEPFPAPADTREATADVACQAATGLPGLRAAVLTAYQQRYVRSHVAADAALRAEFATQTALAAQVLNSGA